MYTDLKVGETIVITNSEDYNRNFIPSSIKEIDGKNVHVQIIKSLRVTSSDREIIIVNKDHVRRI